jgi:hypothetical protein
MALRNQPYIPFYVQDYLSDEKLSCCSLQTQGVYIRIMCALHKSETYGGILFKQIPKQNFSSSKYFAFILSKQIGISTDEVSSAVEELLFFDVLKVEQKNGIDFLFQKRMVKDFEISEARKKAGKKGGGNPILFKQKNKQTDKQNPKQVDKQNPEYESEDEYVIEDENIEKGGMGKKIKPEEIFEAFRKAYPGARNGFETELKNFQKKHKDWRAVIPLLLPALENQQNWRTQAQQHGVFVPSWANLQTWINQRRWEQELNFEFEKKQHENSTRIFIDNQSYGNPTI